MSNSIKKRSRKRKRLIPIGKEVGGYKKHHQYKHRGLKKIRSLGEKSKVKELSETGKTHNKEQVKPCGGQYEEEYVSSSSDDDFPNVAHLDGEAMKLMHSVEIKSESETESSSIDLDRKAVSNILKRILHEYPGNKPFFPFADVDVDTEWTPDYNLGNARLRRRYLASTKIYGDRPTKAQLELNKILGVRDPLTAWTLSPEEVDKLFRPLPWQLCQTDPDSDSGFIRRTRKPRK